MRMGTSKGEWLKAILKLALEEKIIDASAHGQANRLRRLANRAIYGKKLPDQQDCKDGYFRTPLIIRHLYG